MAKRITYAILVAWGFVLAGGTAWLYFAHRAWLAARGLDGLVLLFLIFLTIWALIMPFNLRGKWSNLTEAALVREFVVRGGLIIAAFIAVILLLGLVIALVTLPALIGRPLLILPWLTLLVPLALTGVDFYQGAFRRTLANFSLAFLIYIWRIYGLLLIQFTFIPMAFALFPAGFFLQFLGLADLLMRQFGRFTNDLPLLCEWANLAHPACTPALWSFHLGHVLLALVALRYGRILFDKSSDWYALSLERLAKRLKR